MSALPGVCVAAHAAMPATAEQAVPASYSTTGDVTGARLETSGYAGLRTVQHHGGNGAEAARRSAIAVIRSRYSVREDRVMLQLRPELLYSSAPGVSAARAHVDELYGEHALSPTLFAFLGRRRIVNGVAIGKNPSDFLNATKPEDRTLTDEDRRAEKPGDDLAGWSYFGSSYSIQGVVLPASPGSRRTRALLQVAGKIDALSTDVSVIGYYADRPGVGLNLSSVLGDRITAYIEAAARKGRDRSTPVLDDKQTLIGATWDDKSWFADLVAGGQYTSASGFTLTAEIWKNTNGYTQYEYAGIEQAVLSGRGSVPLAASLLSVATLRRNALFFRISNITLTDSLHLEGTSIYSLDDHSQFWRSAFTWDWTDRDTVRGGIDYFNGPRLREYGVNQTRWRFFLAYKNYF